MNKLSIPFRRGTDPNLGCFTYTGKFLYGTLHVLPHPSRGALNQAIDFCGGETLGSNRYDFSMIGSSFISALSKLKKML